MTTTELEQVIREYIRDIYKKEYIGKLWIQKLNPKGYYIKLGLNTPDQPLVIYGEMEDEDFLKFLKRELKDKRFNLVYYGGLQLTYPQDCNPRNTACGCQKKN